MLLTEKAASSVAATAVVTTTSATVTDPMTNALELQLQNEERREEEAVAQTLHNLRENREGDQSQLHKQQAEDQHLDSPQRSDEPSETGQQQKQILPEQQQPQIPEQHPSPSQNKPPLLEQPVTDPECPERESGRQSQQESEVESHGEGQEQGQNGEAEVELPAAEPNQIEEEEKQQPQQPPKQQQHQEHIEQQELNPEEEHDLAVAEVQDGEDEDEVTTVVVIDDVSEAADEDRSRSSRLRPFFQVVNGKMIAAPATSEDGSSKGGSPSKHAVGLSSRLSPQHMYILLSW